jgi:hypothetical protein
MHAISSTGLPKSCSQARGCQSNLPGAMQPVSSTKVPMIRGLRKSLRSLEQLRQGVWVKLEKTGAPQLKVVSWVDVIYWAGR